MTRRAGEYERGILEGTEALVDRMKHLPTIPVNDNDTAPVEEAA